MNLSNFQKALILIPACALLAGVCIVCLLPREKIISAALILLVLAVIYLVVLVLCLRKNAVKEKKPVDKAGFKDPKNYSKAMNQKSYIKGNVTRNYHNVKH